MYRFHVIFVFKFYKCIATRISLRSINVKWVTTISLVVKGTHFRITDDFDGLNRPILLKLTAEEFFICIEAQPCNEKGIVRLPASNERE